MLLLVTSFFVFMGWGSLMWVGSLITVAIIWFLGPLLPRQANPNHRIGLIGSRFSPLEETGQPAAHRGGKRSKQQPLVVR